LEKFGGNVITPSVNDLEIGEGLPRRKLSDLLDKMTGLIETQLLINNKRVPASDKATFDLFSPHTGELVAKGIFPAQHN
jgi:hypothetical protein